VHTRLERVYLTIAAFGFVAILPRLTLAISDADNLVLAQKTSEMLTIISVFGMGVATTFSQLALAHYLGSSPKFLRVLVVGFFWLGSVVSVAIVIIFHILAGMADVPIEDVLHLDWLIENQGLTYYVIAWVAGFDFGPTALVYCVGQMRASGERDKDEEMSDLVDRFSKLQSENNKLSKASMELKSLKVNNKELQEKVSEMEARIYLPRSKQQSTRVG